MNANAEKMELKERLDLMEAMITQGRRTTRQWGWSFVLWGVAYLVATAWANWTKEWLAWPVTMTAAGLLTGFIATRMKRGDPATALGRAIGAVWIAMGCALMIVLVCLSLAGRYEGHVFVAFIGAMIAAAHATSAIILKWKAQLWCALIWMAASVAACFGSDTVVGIAILSATFLAQIVFGIYAMILESREMKALGARHA